MPELNIDLDQLAMHLKGKMETNGLSLRASAKQIGFGAATLSRLLQGSKNESTPDLAVINKAATWVGRPLVEFSASHSLRRAKSTFADVEVQLRALPDLNNRDVDMLIRMVKAGYESVKGSSTKKSS